MSKVIVFGAGLVARAHVRYLLDHGLEVTVASRTVSKAEAITEGHPNGHPVEFDITRHRDRLAGLIAGHDLAVSLLPWQYHPEIARACIDHGKHMVTTSYVKEPMWALDSDARTAGVILLNELGVDPGIDHMTAMKVIHEAQRNGGRVRSFRSYCGGLPAPEANTNPLGYKFSWSPRGVLLAGKNDARYREDGQEINIPGLELFNHRWPVHVEVEGTLTEFEGYPNRDSVPYAEMYSIPDVDTMFRGTLRMPGWCNTMRTIIHLGLLEEKELEGLDGLTFRQLLARLLDADAGADLRALVAERFSLAPDSKVLSDLEWLDLFSDRPIPTGHSTTVDVMTAHLLDKMAYAEGERDMIVLQHQFIIDSPDHSERVYSTMVDTGIPGGDSAMCRLVGLPAAVGVRYILDGTIDMSGVVVPVHEEVYEPVLEELQRLGVTFTETTEKI
jgi:saccharopine dehydrogenase-like NADP-dependent oxidoreductase